MQSEPMPVRQRRVFHIPGYDPMHPRRYRELYRRESALQAQISGYHISIAAGATEDVFNWQVNARIDGQDVAARIDVLVWSDIVRQSMAQSIPATYWQLVQTAWIYVFTGTLRRLMWMRKGPVIAAFYPVVMLLLQLLLAVWLGATLGGWAAALLLWLAGLIGITTGNFFAVISTLAIILHYTVLAAVVFLLLRFFKAQDGRLFAYYLMHDYAFSARLWGKNPPELEARLKLFADQIADALHSDADEVLVVGHSSGAHLGVSILADLIRDGRVPADGPRLGFLSLGQVVPMMSFLPKARRLRTDLAFLAATDSLTWLDVSAPGDGACFALCDPVAVTGVTPPGKKWPLVISAAFSQSLSSKRWRALRWQFFRRHFQYLCAFDQPKDYDYFQITAGPLTLADRYRTRKPSGSRIDIPVSKYTSIAP